MDDRTGISTESIHLLKAGKKPIAAATGRGNQ
jgi:hypothetical protein